MTSVASTLVYYPSVPNKQKREHCDKFGYFLKGSRW